MSDPEVTACQHEGGTRCYVAVQWLAGRSMMVGDFRNIAEAQVWIDQKSADWLASLPQRIAL